MKNIDFTEAPIRKKIYAGANGGKRSIIFDGEQYMLKFPAPAKLNKELSYTNGCVSEYLGSHIFNILGVAAQETLLGTYKINGKEKIVVACKDFATENITLQDFASLKNAFSLDSSSNGYGTELNDVLAAIEEQTLIDTKSLKEHFWNIFIIDAFIGNWDRHNDNWGFLYNSTKDELYIAPIYDCGGCLYPQADEEVMKNVLSDQGNKDFRVFEIPLSALKEDDRKIRYFDFIYSLKNKDCNAALKRIAPKIDLEKINKLIEGTPYITDLQKSFYKTMLKERKEVILDRSLTKLLRREKNKENER